GHARAELPRPVLRPPSGGAAPPRGRLWPSKGGRSASASGVKEGQTAAVNRHIGPLNMTITVLDNTPNAEGKSLPHSYLVHYWDAATGRLRRVETVQERWARVGRYDLPASHTVTTSSDAWLAVNSLSLSRHRPAGGQEEGFTAESPRRAASSEALRWWTQGPLCSAAEF